MEAKCSSVSSRRHGQFLRAVALLTAQSSEMRHTANSQLAQLHARYTGPSSLRRRISLTATGTGHADMSK